MYRRKHAIYSWAVIQGNSTGKELWWHEHEDKNALHIWVGIWMEWKGRGSSRARTTMPGRGRHETIPRNSCDQTSPVSVDQASRNSANAPPSNMQWQWTIWVSMATDEVAICQCHRWGVRHKWARRVQDVKRCQTRGCKWMPSGVDVLFCMETDDIYEATEWKGNLSNKARKTGRGNLARDRKLRKFAVLLTYVWHSAWGELWIERERRQQIPRYYFLLRRTCHMTLQGSVVGSRLDIGKKMKVI